VKTTVEIPDALFNDVKRYASANSLTFRQVLETSLRQKLNRNVAPKEGRSGCGKRSSRERSRAGEDWAIFRKMLYGE
jgi:hypothetical protein